MAEIQLTDVNLDFYLRSTKRIHLKEFIVNRLLRRKAAIDEVSPMTHVHALKDINLQLRKGDRLGIIGHNGAGKSTLLKLLAGIYPPTTGNRIVKGKICSLFDISLGFEPEANGWDNIRYRGYLQGETPRTLEKKIPDIAAFSELGEFLTVPVRFYSAGMMIRLAFSIASAIEPEILLIDEVLSVGDMNFQHKARIRMETLMERASMMVLISHDLSSLPNLCTHVIWMDHGRIVMQGEVEEVINTYSQLGGNASSLTTSMAA
jgi:ABC-type polysaccharide/polyol phosphate transport system ATPase subunit